MNDSKAIALSRRQFLGRTLLAAAASPLASLPLAGAEQSDPAPRLLRQFARKIKLGVVGNGGRGAWIAKLFQAHGGYEIWAVADYFQEVADACGDAIGVDRARRFSTLSGYKKLIESGVEAVALETPPYFLPDQAKAAVEAGLHVYMAKPVAVDVPGALQVEAAGMSAVKKQRCFLVDYQMPTDPINIEVATRIRDGALGRIAHVRTTGLCDGQSDPPKTATFESRLRNLVWVNDVALGCDYLGNFDIHTIDAMLWVLGQRPVAAMGSSRICRPDAQGDARDVCSLVFEYAGGLVHNHFGQALKNGQPSMELSAAIHGAEANALLNYWGKAYVRGGAKHFGGGMVVDLYKAGAERNIARFYREIVEGRFENETCRRAVDGVLTCVLGYEAGARHTRLSMAEVLRANRRLEVDLSGLKT